MRNGIRKARVGGVTITELLVALIFAGVLCAFAIAGYREYTMRMNRTDAQRDLSQFALRLQRCFQRTRNYSARDCALDIGVNPEATYSTTVENTADTYTLIATPINAQAHDPCGRLTVDQAGVRRVSGTLPAAACWKPGG
ncbi:MAG: type IV pilin protein [Steroidobacteraceae bacterium]